MDPFVHNIDTNIPFARMLFDKKFHSEFMIEYF